MGCESKQNFSPKHLIPSGRQQDMFSLATAECWRTASKSQCGDLRDPCSAEHIMSCDIVHQNGGNYVSLHSGPAVSFAPSRTA
eukprot:6148550-Amphidinium_carterae.2